MHIIQTLSSRLESIPAYTQFLTEQLAAYSLSEEQLFDLKLALQEALVNAIKHGNKFNPALSVEVAVEASEQSITISVHDQGEGFNVEHIPDPTDGANLSKTSGRGLFLIRKLMDQVEFFDCGRGIKMIKFLTKEAGGEYPSGKA
ncbi:MAG: ATP-binding protein [Candidatus Omnitrophica bacterium]|nr:ATP-binding protein [Candidatus Omnitrophota bacterium]